MVTGLSTHVCGQLKSIMTYNIRYDNPGDGVNKWDNRKQDIVRFINYYNPDIFGIQEGLQHQLTYLDNHLQSYSRIGVGRDDGANKGEFCAIYFKKRQFILLEQSTFWLSEDPENVSVGWDASMERICTYGLFEDNITKNKVLIFNTHYDHIGEIARIKSSELILRKIRAINREGTPIILMGDFNATPDNRAIRTILAEFKDLAEIVSDGIYGPAGTFTGFETDATAERRIDYIFIKDLEVIKYRHIDDRMKDDNFLSDHLPVLIDLK